MIVLVGFMGAGKTTVGQLLAAALDAPFADSDQVIAERAGKPIAAIFAEDGEPAFRALEREVIAGLLAGPDAVLALGGGAVQDRATRGLLAGVPTVYLRAGYEEVISRVGGDSGRPMLARPGVRELHARREPLYASVATVTVDVDSRPAAEVARDILDRLDPLDPLDPQGDSHPLPRARYDPQDRARPGGYGGSPPRGRET